MGSEHWNRRSPASRSRKAHEEGFDIAGTVRSAKHHVVLNPGSKRLRTR